MKTCEVGHLTEYLIARDFTKQFAGLFHGKVPAEKNSESIIEGCVFGVDDGALFQLFLGGVPKEEGAGGFIEPIDVVAAEQTIFDVVIVHK